MFLYIIIVVVVVVVGVALFLTMRNRLKVESVNFDNEIKDIASAFEKDFEKCYVSGSDERNHGYAVVTVSAEALQQTQTSVASETEWGPWLSDLPLLPPSEQLQAEEASFVLENVFFPNLNECKGKTYVHGQMSKDDKNVQGEMSKENVQELSDEELSLKPFESKRSKDKKKRRIQAIMGMIAIDSHVSLEAMANQLDVSTKTVWRDISELKEQGVLERIGDVFNGEWSILKKKK